MFGNYFFPQDRTNFFWQVLNNRIMINPGLTKNRKLYYNLNIIKIIISERAVQFKNNPPYKNNDSMTKI